MWLIVLIVSLLLVLLLGLTTFAFYRQKKRKKKRRKQQLREKREGRSRNGAFVPLIYELDETTEFKLEESKRRVRSSGSMAVDSRAARNSLAYDISKVQFALANARDERIGRWPRDELIEKCNQVIREGAASADVYEAVFNTIVGQKEYEVRMQEYKDAAEALLQRLLKDNIAQKDSAGRVVWPQCKQHTDDLAELYMEAVSVKGCARDVMKGLCKGSAADGWRLEPGPLKKMRCAVRLRANSPPLTVASCVRLQSRLREDCAAVARSGRGKEHLRHCALHVLVQDVERHGDASEPDPRLA